jgi:glycerol kinase
MADILNVEVERPKILDGTALGAAFLAGLGCDFWDSKSELLEKRKIDKIFKPDITNEKRDKLYNGWNKAILRSFTWEKH